ALATDTRTNLAPVFVETSLGRVTLSGDVPSATFATADAEVASAAPGVAAVRSLLAIKAPPAPTPAEEKVAEGATSPPVPEGAVTSEPRLEPHSRDQDADRVTRP